MLVVGKRWLGSVAIFTVLGLLLFSYKYLDFAARGRSIPFGIPLIEELTSAWTICIYFPLIRAMARRFPLYAREWRKYVPVHIALALIFSFGTTSLQWAGRLLLTPLFGLGSYSYGAMPLRYFMELPMECIVYAVALTAVYMWDRQMRAAQLESKLAEARLHNLRLQLQPHFLFNVLNTVSSLMYSNPNAADRMIASLAELMRMSLAEAPTPEITLQKEIESLNHYLDLMRFRFEDSLNIEIMVAPGAEHALVPRQILQPLVENALRYGIDSDTATVRVQVQATADGEKLQLLIRDYGAGAKEWPVRRGVGLNNTVQRLSSLYGAQQHVQWENCPDGGFSVKLALPFHV